MQVNHFIAIRVRALCMMCEFKRWQFISVQLACMFLQLHSVMLRRMTVGKWRWWLRFHEMRGGIKQLKEFWQKAGCWTNTVYACCCFLSVVFLFLCRKCPETGLDLIICLSFCHSDFSICAGPCSRLFLGSLPVLQSTSVRYV